jgi:vacuolar-type H+-ATPase subunit C/Vma6
MLRTFRYAFILAKIYGMLAKSFVGENYREILRLRKIGEIYDLLFPGERPEVPEYQLTTDLERRVVEAGIRKMVYVLDLLGTGEPILIHILRKYEYQALKSVVRGLVNGEPQDALIWDLGRYAAIDLAGAGDREKAIAESRYAWLLPMISATPLVRIENALDRDYYVTLHSLAQRLPLKDKSGVYRLVSQEISLANAIWILRLRFFFGLDIEKARDLLVPGTTDAERRAVIHAFDIPPDSAEEWRKWKFGRLLEDQFGESFKAPDPVRAEQKATRELYSRARLMFHQDPFTLTPIVAFFKLKEYEAGMLSTAAEALRLSISEQEVLTLLGEL